MAKEGKKPIGKIILIVVVVLVVIGAVGAMGGKGSSGGDAQQASAQGQAATTEQQAAPEPEPFTISDETLNTENPYSATITGTLTNNTGSEKSFVSVEYVIYDADGAQIGNAYANTTNLKAGGTWKFEAGTLKAPEEIGSWERVEVTGF